MFKLISSVFKRITTAVSSPFRMLIVRIQKMFNVNIISAKLIKPLTANVRKIITLRPSSKADYVAIGRLWVYRKLFYALILALCAGVIIYFAAFAPKVEPAPATMTQIKTDVTFDYDDINVKDFSGTANIRAENGTVVYTGELASGVCKGLGALYDKAGTLLYEGEFANNRYNGEGTGYYPDSTVKYQGVYADNAYQGQGKLYDAAGRLLYDGEFKNGLYDGEGKRYGQNGLLDYEGQFAAGKFHGEGTRYFDDGAVWYRGAFFEGEFQGAGSLYSAAGRLLYTGPMHGGEINYRAFVGATLQDVENAFAETPRIYYQEDGNSCFVYEQTGIILTADCRVKVWLEEREKENPSDGYYYMPGEIPGEGSGGAQSAREEYLVPVLPEPDAPFVLPEPPASSEAPIVLASAEPLTLGDMLTPTSWEIFDPYVPESESSSQGSSSQESSQENSREESSQSEQQDGDGYPSQPDSSATDNGVPYQSPEEEGSSGSSGVMGGGDPDFVEKQLTLYFEIDKDVWRSESSLNENGEKNKIFIRRITVLGGEPLPAEDEGDGMEVEDNAPPSIEDCVAIDYVRQTDPTAFHDISFEMDKQNKLFIRLWNVNYAERISRRVFTVGDQTWRYCFLGDSEELPAYYSIET
ncbi:MAG: MORN repeat-containing protein [Oscillospiraceae bacterium]